MTPPAGGKENEDVLLSAYLDDATNEDETQRVQDRLNQDPEARKTLDLWKKQGVLLKDIHPDSEPPPELVASEVMLAIQRQLGDERRGGAWKLWIGIAALVAVAAVGYFAAGRVGLVPLP
jgi:anti-sigma factor RsiW